MVPCIRDKAIRQVVQTLARFMAAYFSNQTVYIFPPHNPQPLPAIHFQANVLSEWLCVCVCLYVCVCIICKCVSVYVCDSVGCVCVCVMCACVIV